MFPVVERICVHTFVPELLGNDPITVDLGANRGVFAKAIAKRFGCVVHAVEPVPNLHQRLLEIDGIEAHGGCLAPVAETVELHLPQGSDATLYPQSATGSTIRVPGETLGGFIQAFAAPEIDLLKLDVEGAELPALEDTPTELLLLTRQITVEFHDWQRPQTSSRVRAVQERLKDIGFYCIRFSANNGDVLFIRQDLINWAEYLYLALIVRNARGAWRVLRRSLHDWFGHQGG